MNAVDAIVIAAAVVFAWSGWRQGFVAGLFSFVGFLIGGLGAALLLPGLIEGLDLPGLAGAVILAIGILVTAVVGQTLSSFVGRRLRSGLNVRGLQVADSAAGAALNLAALAVVLWIVATAVGLAPALPVAREVQSSLVLRTIDSAVPDAAAMCCPDCAMLLMHRVCPGSSLDLGSTPDPRCLPRMMSCSVIRLSAPPGPP